MISNRHIIGLFLLLTICTAPAAAQGLPLIRNYTAEEYGGHNRCYNIETDSEGTVYVANFEGLLYYDHAQWHILHTPDISRMTVVFRDSRNTIWAGGYNFIARLQKMDNGELFMQQAGNAGQFEGEVTKIFEKDGKLLFAASDNNTYELSVREGEEHPSITPVQHDATGGTSIQNDIIQTEPLDGGLQVKVKKNSGLIIANEHGRALFTITESDGLCSNQVEEVVYDGHGMLWGATAHGVFAIELPSVYSYFLAKDGLSGEVNTITAFDGSIYAGGTGGLFRIANRKCLPIAEINNICWKLSHSGRHLLAATSSGIFSIAPGGSVSRNTSNATTAMLADGDKVYAGEPDGVWLYQSDFRQRTKVSDLPLTTDIRLNSDGSLWLQNVHGKTEGTLSAPEGKPLEDLPANLTMPLGGIDVKSQYRHNDEVWVGGDEILAIIDTSKKELAGLAESRTLRFRSIVKDGETVLWGGFGEMPVELPHLGSNEGNLHFFYSMDYVPLSGKTLYRYRMNDNKWSTWTEKQDVEFLNLPHGSFTLSIQAQLADGELSEITSVDFSIAYPLLMRWYMLVFYLMAFAGIIWLLSQYRLKRLQKDKIKLEQIVEERTADLRSAQHELIRQEKMATVGKLTEGLIDRILNPMNYIINFSKMSKDLLNDIRTNIDKNKDSIDADDYEDTLDVLDMLKDNLQHVDQYGQNTTRTLKAMEEMLKDRTGGYVDMDLLPVLRQNEEMLRNYFSNEIENDNINVTFNLPGSAMPLHGNPEMLSKTMMSLLGNAIYAVNKKAQKNAQFKPEVSLTAEVDGDRYLLKIRDNGNGIEEKILGKIFDPFFTTKTTGEAAGVGLYLSREIIQNHGGDISVDSVKDDHTEFTITLPKLQAI